MTDHRRARGAARPIAAGPVLIRRECPAIGLRPYLLTLPGYGSYWFRIVPARRKAKNVRLPQPVGASYP